MRPPLTNSDHDLAVPQPPTLSPRVAKATLLALLPALLVLEWVAGSAFSLTLFYLLPVALAAWNFGYKAGFTIAGVAGGYCVFVAAAVMPAHAPWAPLAWQSGTTLALFALFAWAVAYHRAFIERLVRFARIDSESGALAQREFERALDAETRRARRYGRPLAVVVMEADGPKQAFDAGFAAKLCDHLRGVLRECDSVARMGPRRFALLLVECPGAEARAVAVGARDGLVRAFDARIAFATSVCAYGAAAPTSAAQILQRVERRLQEVKSGACVGVGVVALA